jgi:hypothetical protein
VSEDLKERIDKLLAGLGDTPDAVADSLRAKNIAGIPSDGECCPVANLIAAECPEAAAGQWGAEADWWVEIGYVRTPDGIVDLPPPVKEFINLFDEGEVIYVDEDGTETVWPYSDLEYDSSGDGEAARAET